MANFLLVIDKIIEYTKKDIDKGNTPLIIYKVCSFIRESFCISYAIRKENNVYLLFDKERFLVLFKGNELKFLGSDERSQALLLQKALNKLFQDPNLQVEDWSKSTPGIYYRKFSEEELLINYITSLDVLNLVFLIDQDTKEIENLYDIEEFNDLTNLSRNFYIISLNIPPIKYKRLIDLFGKIKTKKFINLSKIKAIEDKVLFINYQIDQKK
ncbi:MAG: hypothetical protein ACFFAO_10265 [Candidatus Hermodarchaeota archaeon]